MDGFTLKSLNCMYWYSCYSMLLSSNAPCKDKDIPIEAAKEANL